MRNKAHINQNTNAENNKYSKKICIISKIFHKAKIVIEFFKEHITIFSEKTYTN